MDFLSFIYAGTGGGGGGIEKLPFLERGRGGEGGWGGGEGKRKLGFSERQQFSC